jgi:hypothetical protein
MSKDLLYTILDVCLIICHLSSFLPFYKTLMWQRVSSRSQNNKHVYFSKRNLLKNEWMIMREWIQNQTRIFKKTSTLKSLINRFVKYSKMSFLPDEMKHEDKNINVGILEIVWNHTNKIRKHFFLFNWDRCLSRFFVA